MLLTSSIRHLPDLCRKETKRIYGRKVMRAWQTGELPHRESLCLSESLHQGWSCTCIWGCPKGTCKCTELQKWDKWHQMCSWGFPGSISWVGWKGNFRGTPGEGVWAGCALTAGLVLGKSLGRPSSCKARPHPAARLGGPGQVLHEGWLPSHCRERRAQSVQVKPQQPL